MGFRCVPFLFDSFAIWPIHGGYGAVRTAANFVKLLVYTLTPLLAIATDFFSYGCRRCDGKKVSAPSIGPKSQLQALRQQQRQRRRRTGIWRAHHAAAEPFWITRLMPSCLGMYPLQSFIKLNELCGDSTPMLSLPINDDEVA